MEREVKVGAGIARITQRCLLALATILLVVTVALVNAEEAVNPDGVAFGESTPVSDEGLARVHGTGVTPKSPLPRNDVAVILWDEQPKVKPAPTPTEGGNGSQIEHTSIRVR
jgi:hypothetical protein